ncbi:mitochondrial carrier domain-containing protein [Melampsora americana]|nr:mitochondrial carrier domain-containing protein [Melampsora americana]
MADSETTKDVIAGWIGGAAGILISNPLEVLKVRIQTNPSSHISSDLTSIALSRSPSPVHHCVDYEYSSLALKYSIPPMDYVSNQSGIRNNSLSHPHSATQLPHFNSTLNGLRGLWRQEGYRFLFAGAAAPILGLAFIDSFFFATYGKCMSLFGQDRERPEHLTYVFASGAFAGGCCALLQTPIEVIKCRAQAEHVNQMTGVKLGSYEILSGLRGFYLGGLMTGFRDSISSGIFFTSSDHDAVIDAIIRGLLSSHPVQREPNDEFTPSKTTESSSRSPKEILQIMLAGALSGTISALLPYPLDIIKTRLQVNKLATSSNQSSAGSQRTHLAAATPSLHKHSPAVQNLTVPQIVKQIYGDGKHEMLPNAHRTRLYRFVDWIIPQWAPVPQQKLNQPIRPDIWLVKRRRKVLRLSLRLGGMMGFFRGLKPTLLSSFVGSGITMGIFEYVFEFLGRRQGSNGIVDDVKLIN